MDMADTTNDERFPWATRLSPRLLKSPWWIGHIPFAYELIARLRPRTIVELGTYSGSSFAAFCQAVEACGIEAKCYGIDLWQGDIHMGTFDEELYREISEYMAATYPGIATLVRKDFNEAARQFEAASVDLLHIDGTHTYEAVGNDFHTWLPKMSDRGVVLFHDTNVTVQNAGEAALRFGVRKFFDGVKADYPHLEFGHCWGLGVLVVGEERAGGRPGARRSLPLARASPRISPRKVARCRGSSRAWASRCPSMAPIPAPGPSRAAPATSFAASRGACSEPRDRPSRPTPFAQAPAGPPARDTPQDFR